MFWRQEAMRRSCERVSFVVASCGRRRSCFRGDRCWWNSQCWQYAGETRVFYSSFTQKENCAVRVGVLRPHGYARRTIMRDGENEERRQTEVGIGAAEPARVVSSDESPLIINRQTQQFFSISSRDTWSHCSILDLLVDFTVILYHGSTCQH